MRSPSEWVSRIGRGAVLKASLLSALCGLGLTAAPHSARAADPDDFEEPDEDWVWEDGDVVDKTTHEGFYRPRERPGYVWTEGHYEANGEWVPGDFRPGNTPAQDQVWERGFRGPDGYFVVGAWRPAARAGYAWVPGHWDHGLWVPGIWRPVDERPNSVWVPGHWVDGTWIDGHWRESRRADNNWVEGHWRWGRWVPGYWRPLRAKPGNVWVAGTWGPSGWIDGTWRPARRSGYYWRPARWEHGVWVGGDWVGGKPVAKRAHPAVRPVPLMIRSRATARHVWRAGVRQEIRHEVRHEIRKEHREQKQNNHHH